MPSRKVIPRGDELVWPSEDGSDVGPRIGQLFEVWNTPPDARLRGRMVPYGRRICTEGERFDWVRRHEFNNPGRASGSAMAAALQSIWLRDCVCPPHVRVGLRCSPQSACARNQDSPL